jgi:hypothetical protein
MPQIERIYADFLFDFSAKISHISVLSNLVLRLADSSHKCNLSVIFDCQTKIFRLAFF